MTCINKKIKRVICICLIIAMAILLAGCGRISYEDVITYDIYESSRGYNLISGSANSDNNLFAKDLGITNGADKSVDKVDAACSEGGILVNRNTKEIKYSKNVFGKMYPASTTKLLTALVCVKYANLDDVVTVSEFACKQTNDSSVCGLQPGDRISYRNLLYGLMLRSGNDAAIAIAEGMSGSVEEFAVLMNKEARECGATHSHFVNANGLHNDDHYTTVYDMYLIFEKVLDYKLLYDIITTTAYDVAYTSATGAPIQQQWANTNMYLTNQVRKPRGVVVLGGKTGTTNPAGYCLVLLSRNDKNEEIISIVYKADSRNNLYYVMNQLLETFGS